MTKTMRARMADEGLTSYIVRFENAYGDPDFYQQYWAENAEHAREQHDDATDGDSSAGKVISVMTQDEYEAATGNVLGYGRGENY